MKNSGLLILVLLVSTAFVGCAGTTSSFLPVPEPASSVTPMPATPAPVTANPPTSTPDIPPLPTKIRVIVTTPQIPPPRNEANPTSETGNVITDPTLLKLVNEAKADATSRASVLPDEVTLKSAQAMEWGDASLGCPVPGMFYAQVITPGYLIVLEAGGKEWEYHASNTHVMWCDK